MLPGLHRLVSTGGGSPGSAQQAVMTNPDMRTRGLAHMVVATAEEYIASTALMNLPVDLPVDDVVKGVNRLMYHQHEYYFRKGRSDFVYRQGGISSDYDFVYRQGGISSDYNGTTTDADMLAAMKGVLETIRSKKKLVWSKMAKDAVFQKHINKDDPVSDLIRRREGIEIDTLLDNVWDCLRHLIVLIRTELWLPRHLNKKDPIPRERLNSFQWRDLWQREDFVVMYGPIEAWDTSEATDMEYMFYGVTSFNQPIGAWNTSSVTNVHSLFKAATSFNQPIGKWNTSNVTNMRSAFADATSFNQPVGDWNTTNVVDMWSTFAKATSFNKPIGKWNTSNVTNMSHMFIDATSFNQPIGTWNTKNVFNMNNMFNGATSFEQSIDDWDTSKVPPTLGHGYKRKTAPRTRIQFRSSQCDSQ